MNDNKKEGTAKDLSGKVKEGAGKAVDDDKMKREGKADQVEGSAQKTVGEAEDAVKK